jgi:hypothetical protein
LESNLLCEDVYEVTNRAVLVTASLFAKVVVTVVVKNENRPRGPVNKGALAEEVADIISV